MPGKSKVTRSVQKKSTTAGDKKKVRKNSTSMNDIDTVQELSQDPVHDTVHDTVQDVVHDVVQDPVQDVVKDKEQSSWARSSAKEYIHNTSKPSGRNYNKTNQRTHHTNNHQPSVTDFDRESAKEFEKSTTGDLTNMQLLQVLVTRCESVTDPRAPLGHSLKNIMRRVSGEFAPKTYRGNRRRGNGRQFVQSHQFHQNREEGHQNFHQFAQKFHSQPNFQEQPNEHSAQFNNPNLDVQTVSSHRGRSYGNGRRPPRQFQHNNRTRRGQYTNRSDPPESASPAPPATN